MSEWPMLLPDGPALLISLVVAVELVAVIVVAFAWRFVRFSIRDLLWLTLVVAMGFGWFLDREQLKDRWRQVSRELATLRQNIADGMGGAGGATGVGPER